jgi:hypothetical protein
MRNVRTSRVVGTPKRADAFLRHAIVGILTVCMGRGPGPCSWSTALHSHGQNGPELRSHRVNRCSGRLRPAATIRHPLFRKHPTVEAAVLSRGFVSCGSTHTHIGLEYVPSRLPPSPRREDVKFICRKTSATSRAAAHSMLLVDASQQVEPARTRVQPT